MDFRISTLCTMECLPAQTGPRFTLSSKRGEDRRSCRDQVTDLSPIQLSNEVSLANAGKQSWSLPDRLWCVSENRAGAPPDWLWCVSENRARAPPDRLWCASENKAEAPPDWLWCVSGNRARALSDRLWCVSDNMPSISQGGIAYTVVHTAVLRQNCRSNLPTRQVRIHRHWTNQSLQWSYNMALAEYPLEHQKTWSGVAPRTSWFQGRGLTIRSLRRLDKDRHGRFVKVSPCVIDKEIQKQSFFSLHFLQQNRTSKLCLDRYPLKLSGWGGTLPYYIVSCLGEDTTPLYNRQGKRLANFNMFWCNCAFWKPLITMGLDCMNQMRRTILCSSRIMGKNCQHYLLYMTASMTQWSSSCAEDCGSNHGRVITLKTGTLVSSLLDVWWYAVSATILDVWWNAVSVRTGWPGVSIAWLGEIAS